MVKQKHGLKDYVYRILARRVMLAALLIAFVLATSVFVSQRDEVGSLVEEIARNQISILRTQTITILEKSEETRVEAFQQALENLKSAQQQTYLGRFTYARFYTPEGKIFSESDKPEETLTNESSNYLGDVPRHFPGAELRKDVLRINGRPHIHIIIPIYDVDEQLAAYAEGLFAVSDAVLSDLQWKALKAALWVALIVLVTAAILYPTILSLTRRLASYSEDLLGSHLETVQTLGSAIAKRDSDTSAHNFRVTLMAIRMAEELGLPPVNVQKLIIGAFLHDVGKIGIRDNILLKPGPLDDAEFDVMKTHVNHGVEIITGTEFQHDQQPEHVDIGIELLSSSSWLSTANDVVSAHHEKYDGSGYPNGLVGDEIPLEARIFAVVDVFDALSCKRPYKKPFSYEKTLQILEEGRGNHFDPQVHDTFILLADELFTKIAGREDEQLKYELEEAANRYFFAGMEALKY